LAATLNIEPEIASSGMTVLARSQAIKLGIQLDVDPKVLQPFQTAFKGSLGGTDVVDLACPDVRVRVG